MSLSTDIDTISNPTTKFIEFNGQKGVFSYFDKEADNPDYNADDPKLKLNREKGVRVELDLPLEFIVLDELATIKGYNDLNQTGIYSNEVHNTTEEELVVKTFKPKQVLCKGLYEDIKLEVNSQGGKYHRSLYAYMKGELVNFSFKGAALSAWFEKDFKKAIGQVVQIPEELETGKKGSITYQIPKFIKIGPAKDHPEFEQALEKDKQLQDYLKQYKKLEGPNDKKVQDELEVISKQVDDEDDIPPF